MISTQYINLNMVPSGVMPVLHCSQYDVGRPLGVVIYNGSESVDLSGYTVTIEGTRTDRTPVTAGVTTDGNIGVFTTTPTMTNENDTYRAKVVLTDNAGRVSSLAFVMCVDEKTMDENAEEIEEDASLYQQYTGTVQTIIAQIRGDLAAEITARQNAISAEASARQTADNTLQSNINAEASARATEDASLQSQINQLIAPSGSAPSAAEVENARIGSDGTIYPTLGDAIRTQNSLLKSQINDVTDEIGVYSSVSFNVPSGSSHSATSDRIAVNLPAGSKIFVKIDTLGTETISCNVIGYKSDDTNYTITAVTTNAGYQTIPVSVTYDTFYIGIYAPAQSANVTYKVWVQEQGAYTERIKANTQKCKMLNQSVIESNSGKCDFSLLDDFVNGTLENGVVKQSYGLNRIASPDILHTDSDIAVTIASGFRLGINYFVGGVYSQNTGWLTGNYTIPASSDFKMMISRSSEDASEIADIPTFVKQVTYATELSEYIQASDESILRTALESGVNGVSYIDSDNYELGNISINALGWTYSSSTQRVRTKENYDLELEVGDVVRIKDATKASFYIGFKTSKTTYGASGAWVTEWTATYGGQYALVIKAVPEATQTSKYALLSQLEIIKYNNASQNVKILRSANEALESINHRGMNRNAPENTIPAFKQSKRYGFSYVETDIAWTSDGVPVCLHDQTINRTARNADGTALESDVNIADITYETALTYDFGIWKADKWEGTQIPTFEQVATLCKKQGVGLCVEVKAWGYTAERLSALVDKAKELGLGSLILWTSFESSILSAIKTADSTARLGLLSASINSTVISTVQFLMGTDNEVVLMSSVYTESAITLCKNAGIPLYAYTINDTTTMNALPLYLSGVTSDLYPVNVVWSESAS